MARPAYDPRRIFRIAEWFWLASNTLGEHVSARRGVLVPKIVLSAFSLELYFKCLIAVETGKKPPSGHNLRWLFNKLSNDTQQSIRDCFDNPDQRETHFREVLKNPEPPIPKHVFGSSFDFDALLDESSKAFQRFRYIFENLEPKDYAAWKADYILKCTRQVIIGMHPDWDKPEANY